MRIGIITYGLGRSSTGIGRYTFEVVRAMHQANNAPEIILITGEGLGPLETGEFDSVKIKVASIMPLLMTTGSAQLPFVARRYNLDIIHDPVGVAPFMFGTGKAKSISTIHDVFPLSFPGVSTKLDTLIYKHWLPYASKRLDAIITVSQHSKGDIVAHLPVPEERVHVTPNAADDIYKPASDDDITRIREKYQLPENYILFVGSIEERKNLKRVLEAFAIVREKLPSYKLALVGPKKWKFTEIMQTVESHHLTDDLIFTGFVDNEDLPVIYSGADLFVFPSLYEGFGLPPLEAMSCGTPVVTSNSSSLPEAVGDAAITVDPYDVNAIADAMVRILTDSELSKQLSEAGLEQATHFSWKKNVQMILDVYESVLS